MFHRRASLMFVVIVAAFLTSFFVSGCGPTMGSKLDSAAVNKIQKGVTTRAQVEAAVGMPTNTSILPDGRRMAMYFYSESKSDAMTFVPYAGIFAGSSNRRDQNLQVIYKENIVDDYEFSDTSKHVEGGLVNPHGTTVKTPDGSDK